MIATQVSRPIRSASASGPSGCAKPSVAMVSIASGSATPSISAQAASLMNGIRMRLETNPGKSRASAGVLPSSSREGDDRRRRLVGGLEPADDLDELQHGHRVEEVHADHAVGPARGRGQRGDRDRRGVRGQDRLGRQRLVGAAEHVLLDGRRPRRRPRSSGRRRPARRPARRGRAPRPGRLRPSPPGGSGSCAWPRGRGRSRPGRGRRARRGVPRPRPPARSRRPSGRRRRRGHARSAWRRRLSSRPCPTRT